MNKGIDVEVIKHSISWTGIPIYTLVLKYPRYIHSELMTHRVFSKNSASSRAIPINKMISNIKEDMVQPIWTLNQAGMQGIILDKDNIKATFANEAWRSAFDKTLSWVDHLVDFGIHKQNVNRLLEPWMHIKIILTGTDFSNWFELRDHPDAQPEIQALARKMKEKMEESKPEYLVPGQWHIPFIKEGEIMPNWDTWNEDYGDYVLDHRLKVSVARCARISYNNVDGSNSTVEKDIELFDKLITSKPLHASPAEHQARVPLIEDYVHNHMSIRHEVLYKKDKQNYNTNRLVTLKGKYFSNLQGWIQYRKILEEQFKDK